MNRIAQLRKERGLSQQQLAQKLHVHQTAVSQWEKERTEPSIAAVFDMCTIFDVQADYLLGKNDERSNFYSDPGDGAIIDMAKELSLPEGLPNDLSAMKSIMNASGYNLTKVHGEYYLTGHSGGYLLQEEQVEELRNSSVQYVEYLCAKLERELSGNTCGILEIPKYQKEKKAEPDND